MFRSLEYDRVASCQRRADLYGNEKQLRIPGYHGGNHAERFAQRHRHHVRLVDRQGLPAYLVGKSGIVLKEVRDIVGLPTGFLKQFSGIDCFTTAQRFGMLCQDLRKAAQHLASSRWRQRGP